MYDIKTLNHTPMINSFNNESFTNSCSHPPLDFMSPSRFQPPVINPPTYGIQGEWLRDVMGNVVGTYNPPFGR